MHLLKIYNSIQTQKFYFPLLYGTTAKSIWFTEFGFSNFTGWFDAGLQGQADHLQQAINIIQTQWSSFIHAACVYEYSDGDLVDNREGYFGLLYRNFTFKPSGLVFMDRI